MTWGSYHRRHEILRVTVARAADGQLDRPWRGVAGLSLEFDSDAEVLQELFGWWLRCLVAKLHGLELTACTRQAYDEVVAANPGLRALIDHYSAHPALAEGVARERALVGAVAA